MNSRRALADDLQNAHGQSGRAFDEREQLAARNEICRGVLGGRGCRRLRAMSDDGHLAKQAAWSDLREDPPATLAHCAGDFHLAVLDQVNAVAGIAFAKNLLPVHELPLERNLTKRPQLIGVEVAEQLGGLQRDHARNLGQNKDVASDG